MKMAHPVSARTASVVEKKDAIGKLSEAPVPVDPQSMGKPWETIGKP